MCRLFPSLRLGAVILTVVALSSTAMAQRQSLLVTATEKEVFDRVNNERAKANAGKRDDDPTRLRMLLPSSILFTTARGHAKNMSVKGADHLLDGKTPTQRAREVGFPPNAFAGENIASGQLTPEACVAEWMASKAGHREAILDPRAKIIGVGVAQSSNGTFLWCINYSGNLDGTGVTVDLVVEPAPLPVSAPLVPPTGNPGPVPVPGAPAINPGPGPVGNPNVPRPSSPPTFVSLLPLEKELLDGLNAERAKLGVPALVINAKLYRIASSHARGMIAAGQLVHVLDGKSPTDRGRAAGYPSEVEEVFNGGGVSAQRVVADFMGAENLKAKLLSPRYTETGICWTTSADGTFVWNITLGNSPEAANPAQVEVFRPATQP